MATAISARHATLAIGAVLARAFRLVGRNPLLLFTLALIVAGVPRLALVLLTNQYSADMVGNARGGPAAMISLLSGHVLQALTASALIIPILRADDGGKTGLGASLAPFVRRLPILLGVAILYAIGLCIGLLFLAVPYFFLATTWAVAAPAAGAEPIGVNAAFARSKALVKGERLRILGIGLVALAAMFLIFFAVGLVGLLMFPEAELLHPKLPGSIAIGTIGAAASSVFVAAVQCALYLELRDRKDGPSERLGAIFS